MLNLWGVRTRCRRLENLIFNGICTLQCLCSMPRYASVYQLELAMKRWAQQKQNRKVQRICSSPDIWNWKMDPKTKSKNIEIRALACVIQHLSPQHIQYQLSVVVSFSSMKISCFPSGFTANCVDTSTTTCFCSMILMRDDDHSDGLLYFIWGAPHTQARTRSQIEKLFNSKMNMNWYIAMMMMCVNHFTATTTNGNGIDWYNLISLLVVEGQFVCLFTIDFYSFPVLFSLSSTISIDLIQFYFAINFLQSLLHNSQTGKLIRRRTENQCFVCLCMNGMSASMRRTEQQNRRW